MMALEAHGPDTYIGVGPEYPWGGLYGGQIVAQALRAAGLTVDPAYRVHSLHAYFIRLGDTTEPIRFEVDRVRNGRSFVTRRVVARQSVGAILTMASSFQVPETAPDAQTARLRETIDPATVPNDTWSPVFDRRMDRRQDLPGVSTGWFRMEEDLGDDPMLNACAVAFISDDLPTEAVIMQHPERPAGYEENHLHFWSASLDHAIWFHRPLRADRWHVHDFTCHGLMSSRGLAIGHVFTDAGDHAATVAQEVLLRRHAARA